VIEGLESGSLSIATWGRREHRARHRRRRRQRLHIPTLDAQKRCSRPPVRRSADAVPRPRLDRPSQAIDFLN